MTLVIINRNGTKLVYSDNPEYSSNGQSYSQGDMERIKREEPTARYV